MGRIFIAAGLMAAEQGDYAHRLTVHRGTTVRQILLLRDLVVQILRSRQFEAVAVPDDLSLSQAIEWINARAQKGDVALDLYAAMPPIDQGTAIYYIAENEQRRIQAQQLLQAYLRRVPQLASQGTKSDSQTNLGRLAFCRDLAVPALLMQVGRLTNLEDQWVIPAQPQDVALGMAEGLAGWSQAMDSAAADYPTIGITLNGAFYDDEGILVEGNPYIPVDLVDQLGVEVGGAALHRLRYRHLVYARAIDLRDHNLSVSWDKDSSTLNLRSLLMLTALPNQIMGRGNTSEVQMLMFLKAQQSELSQFADLPKLYREEAAIEGVNHDLAFAQMCLETDFLRFPYSATPEQNNFAGLSGIGAATQTFLDARIGVRAHVQHLKAYASPEPLIQQSVDPRFRFVRRGVAPTVSQLSERWSADPQYGTKLIAIVRRLYESAGFL
ncbi:glucosaminidase domain-containing protein [Phormidium tenue FACHB-886]|nr:glucosaminidase domain-containing protein [Phormidium tenue FACHB-886]